MGFVARAAENNAVVADHAGFFNASQNPIVYRRKFRGHASRTSVDRVSRCFRTEVGISLWLQHARRFGLAVPETDFPSQSRGLPYLSFSIHAALRDFVAFLRAMRGLFMAAAAGFLALGPALTSDSNSCFGCFGVR
jgi:hypothetical protein